MVEFYILATLCMTINEITQKRPVMKPSLPEVLKKKFDGTESEEND